MGEALGLRNLPAVVLLIVLGASVIYCIANAFMSISESYGKPLIDKLVCLVKSSHYLLIGMVLMVVLTAVICVLIDSECKKCCFC